MKKWILLLLMTVLLAGCAPEETFETVVDELVLPAMAQPGYICVELPGETAMPVIENDNGRVYVCNDYEIVLQTLTAGDLESTITEISGLTSSDVTVVKTMAGGISRYEFVWAAAGETGDQTGRAAILDDGNYHYCMTVLRSAEDAEKTQVNWDQVFSSFSVALY